MVKRRKNKVSPNVEGLKFVIMFPDCQNFAGFEALGFVRSAATSTTDLETITNALVVLCKKRSRPTTPNVKTEKLKGKANFYASI